MRPGVLRKPFVTHLKKVEFANGSSEVNTVVPVVFGDIKHTFPSSPPVSWIPRSTQKDSQRLPDAQKHNANVIQPDTV